VSVVMAGRTDAGPRRSRLWIALLAVSLVLNLCFIAGAVWSRMNPPAGRLDLADRYRQMAAQLDLNPQQRAAFDRFVAGIRSRTEQMRQETDPLMSAAWEELAKPQPDTAKVERLFDEAAEKRRATQHEATSQTVELLGVLSPAQRAKFVSVMREWRAAWRQRAGSRNP
jgi:Spy/CpxP family protein refolding chaperone